MSKYIIEFTEGVTDVTPEKIENALAIFFSIHSKKVAKKFNVLPNIMVTEINQNKEDDTKS